MEWTDISFTPARRTLRQFAGLWIVFFGALACWQGFLRQHWVVAALFLMLAAAVGPLGLVRPPAIRLVYVGWMLLAFPIAWTVSRILLALLFYGMITPIALVFRIVGRDVLQRRFRRPRVTYWAAKPAPADLRSYFRQF